MEIRWHTRSEESRQSSYRKCRAYFIEATIAACGMIRGCSGNNKYWIPTDFNITPLHESSFISHYWNSYENFFPSPVLFSLPALISFPPPPPQSHILFLSFSYYRYHPNPVARQSRSSLVKFLRPAVFATSNVRGQAEAGFMSSFRIARNLWGSAHRYTFIEHRRYI